MVVYRVTPADVESGVRVGDVSYHGYQASSAGVAGADAGLKIGFFALLHDQDLNAPVRVFARDAAGNEATAAVEVKVFEKVFRKSRIDVDDAFLAKVVPPILANTPTLKVNDPSNLLESYLTINRELRKQNGATLAALAEKSAPDRLWQGPFKQLVNSAVESGFADHRTYVYQGREVDQQVHLGFDLASTSAAPVHASNAGRVVLAEFLGIYGNCVVVDHGLGPAVALRPPVLDRREGRRHRHAGAGAGPQRHDRPGRRRSPALHDAARRPSGDADRLVEPAVGAGSRAAQAARGERAGAPAAARPPHRRGGAGGCRPGQAGTPVADGTYRICPCPPRPSPGHPARWPPPVREPPISSPSPSRG